MITSYNRGHPIEYNGIEWVYSDDKTTIAAERKCMRCGRMPTSEGYDACIGRIEGAVSACCGHGVENGYAVYKTIKSELCKENI